MTWALEEGKEFYFEFLVQKPCVGDLGCGEELEISIRPGVWHISILGPKPGCLGVSWQDRPSSSSVALIFWS